MGSATEVLYPAESIGGKHRGRPNIGRRHRSCLQLLKACARSRHLTCNLTQVVAGGSGGAESNLFWALVYVPQGTTAGHSTSQLRGATPSSMYRPNQFVMNCGVIDPTAGPIRIYSLSRNLNDGDKISLLIRPTLDGAATIISLCVRYAITLN